MYPVLPHLVSEALTIFKINHVSDWPSVDKKLVKKDDVKIVIQINGKKRDIDEFKNDIDEETLVKNVINKKELKKYFEGKKIIKKIYVKNKIINFIVQ